MMKNLSTISREEQTMLILTLSSHIYLLLCIFFFVIDLIIIPSREYLQALYKWPNLLPISLFHKFQPPQTLKKFSPQILFTFLDQVLLITLQLIFIHKNHNVNFQFQIDKHLLMSSQTQTLFSKYEQISQIGKGSFGVVKKVRRLTDNKTLVWKQINYSHMSSRQRQQLVTEVNVHKDLSHPHIVKYYDRMIDHKQRKVYIVMQYCSGGDLATYLKELKAKKEFIPEDVIWKFAHQIILALEECHKKKILHRDIKPANIFIDQNEFGDSILKLGDFGLSRQLGQHSEYAQTNVGTPYYMSPQQVKESQYNQKSDIWSAGCIFYEIASLRRPFEATNQLALAEKICKGKFDRIPLRFSEDLQKLVENMLIIDPLKRLGTEDIIKLPYFSIRQEEKQMKKLLAEVRSKQEQLLAKKIKLLQQIKEAESSVQIEHPPKFYLNQKDNRMRKSQNLRERQSSNKENFMNFGNITDRY